MHQTIIQKNRTDRISCRRRVVLLGMSLFAISGSVWAELAQSPLFVAQQAKPNIMLTIDNSGSMAWGSLTGYDGKAEYDNGQKRRAYHSSDYNKLYYNPAVTYVPAVDYKGVSMGDSPPTAARIDPFPTSGGTTTTVNLKQTCYGSTLPSYNPGDFSANSNCVANSSGTQRARYAFYYKWNGSTNIKIDSPGDGAFSLDDRVDIIPSTGTYMRPSSRTDCTVSGATASCAYAQEIQNFANWFTYYRTRILTAKTAMGIAFAGIDPVEMPEKESRFRVGFNAINGTTYDRNGNAQSNTAVSDGSRWLTIRDFDEAQKKSLYEKLYAVPPGGGTPLRTQMDRIGRLFSKELGSFDYTDEDPYHVNRSDKRLISCRASYHVMMTDGYWNDSFSSGRIGNQDGSNSGYSTRARGSYDAYDASNTLADIALYYYKTDLRTNIENKVPQNPEDSDNPSTHQHVVTFTIGLGQSGTLDYQSNYEKETTGDFADIKAGRKNWPKPTGDEKTTIDDLWHAAVNGRGTYFSAKDPKEFQESMIEALAKIGRQPGSASTYSVSGNELRMGSKIFEPSFESGVWLGHLKAFEMKDLKNDGTIGKVLKWDAASLLPSWAGRNIATWNGFSGVSFTWERLTQDQKAALGNSQDLLNYLRGDGSKERSEIDGIYRERAYKLGDIVNSTLKLFPDVDARNQGYYFNHYTAFANGKLHRTPMLYVGANDGMLHVFNAETGIEKFAYVPASVFPKLKNLSSPTYSHQYYVDGQLTENDAYLNGWKTILMGTTGAGAKSVFAIDITKPDDLGPSKVMWENSDSNDPDMGYVLGKAYVVKLSDGRWAAIYGNGYYSADKRAVLYIVNAENGVLIKKIVTPPEYNLALNGLSTPSLELYSTSRHVVAVYAGDLQGNLWKFDLSSKDSANWKVAYSNSPMFTAKDNSSERKVQPIVQQPALYRHPGGGLMVNFATGKLIDMGDEATTQAQALYGIWDKPGATASVTKGQLAPHTLDAAARTEKVAINWTNGRGWYMNMPKLGERAIGTPRVDDGIFFTNAFVPKGSLCSAGGDSRLYYVDYLTGNGTRTLYDTNGDGVIDENDGVVIDLGTGTTDFSIHTMPVDRSSLPPACGFDGLPACPKEPHCALGFMTLDAGSRAIKIRCPNESQFRTWRVLPTRYGDAR